MFLTRKMDNGHLVLNIKLWTLNIGNWTLANGQLTINIGQWTFLTWTMDNEQNGQYHVI